jgi:hypothetical protein
MKDQDRLLDLQTTDSFGLYLDEVGRHPLLTVVTCADLSPTAEEAWRIHPGRRLPVAT